MQARVGFPAVPLTCSWASGLPGLSPSGKLLFLGCLRAEGRLYEGPVLVTEEGELALAPFSVSQEFLWQKLSRVDSQQRSGGM